MNPTERFLSELMKLLRKYEEETGTYIELITIKRFGDREMSEVRQKRIISEIKFDIS